MPPPVIFVLGILLLLVILHDAFEVMLLPRRVRSRMRVVRVFFRSTWWAWARIAGLIRNTDSRHSCLSLYGPLSIVALLVVWAGGLVSGFAMLYSGLGLQASSRFPALNLLYFSGVTFFTLGYGDVLPHTAFEKLLVVVEAGTGLGFIATVIGYLPVLYQLFAKREAKVIMLDAAAGSPPCASTLLIRYAEGESMEQLDLHLVEWQQWCAELMESQLSYPMLAFYRSQHDNQSWLAALTAIMDSCALLMVGFTGVRTFRARLTFSTARQAVIEMGRVFQLGPASMPHDLREHDQLNRDRLPAADYIRLAASLANAGLNFSDNSDAEQRLAAFRKTYEPFLESLSEYLLLPLPEWLPGENQLDNWQHNPRGKSARQLVEAVDANPE